MRKYFTVWFSKDSKTIYTNMEFETKKEAINHADKHISDYEDALVFLVAETDRRTIYKLVESIFNNK